jgi:hypothetical protein
MHVVLLIAVGFALAANTRAGEAIVAGDGAARMPIVISAKASPETRAVAGELAGYLQRITGAKLEIATGDGHAGIVLGTLAEFPDPALVKPLEVRDRFDGREAYAIRCEPGRVRLIGATELGASHAAFRFLESIGCRWFFPAKEWEVVPSMPNLKVSLDETDRPRILSRRIWYGWGHFSDKAHPNKPGNDYQAWARHNRMASSLEIHAGHAWQDIILANKKLFDEHPEYLALTSGKRQGDQLCVSNPAVRQLAVDHVLAQFKRRPGLEMASIECADGSGLCECENCRKLGSFSNQVFDLANHVARAVAAKYPGKMVGLYAYHEHCEPPTFDLEPNMYVQLTAGFTTGKYTFDELLDLWPQRCKNLGYYDYFSVWTWDRDRLPGGRGGDVPYLIKAIKRYADHHATSIDAESGNNWGPHGRGYYIANRLMWNPNSDAAAILADFYDKAFGPAASAMKRYYERLDPGNKPMLSRHLLALAFRDVEESTKLAKDRPDVLARLDAIKQYLRYEHLSWLRDRETDKEKQKQLALAVIAHCYRTRYAYMIHWRAMEQQGTPIYAKQFNEPAWSIQERSSPKAWQDERPISRDEIDRDFNEGLAYFVPDPLDERHFSDDLVPANFPDAPPPAASAQQFQHGCRYALYSRTGEDLALDITAGTIAWYRNHAAARYVLRDAAEQVITQDRLPLDGQPHHLSLKVSKPGLYWFDFDDSAAGWRIAAEPGRSISLLLSGERDFMHAGHMQRMYFFVPKATKRIDYFWTGDPHQVLGPDGKLIKEINATGEFVHIQVPAGADGKLWSFKQLALGQLCFFNCPKVLAASPQALLLPREVVEQK